MKKPPLLFIFAVLFALLATSCEKATIPGVSDEEVKKEDILGGWGNAEIRCYMDHKENLFASRLKSNMQNNLKKRAEGSALYITLDSVYFIERHETGYHYVKAISSYELLPNPMRIELQNDHLMFNAYAPKLYIQIENGKLCLCLMKDEVMKLLEDDGSVSSYMGLIRSNIDDAQFKFYYRRNSLDIYQDIESGHYVHTAWE
jgi:hypothetical protein